MTTRITIHLRDGQTAEMVDANPLDKVWPEIQRTILNPDAALIGPGTDGGYVIVPSHNVSFVEMRTSDD